MQDAWKTEASVSALLQQDRKLQQQRFSLHDTQQQQQHEACHYGVQEQQQRQEEPVRYAQQLQGSAAATKTMVHQLYTQQQPFFKQQGYGHTCLQQQVSMRANTTFLQQQMFPPLPPQWGQQQPHMQYPSTRQQEQPYVPHAQQQQPTLQQHILQEYIQQQQQCAWPVAKKERPSGDPLMRLTVTVMKYRCRHAASRRGRRHGLESRNDVSAAGESISESGGSSLSDSDTASSTGNSSSTGGNSNTLGDSSSASGSSKGGSSSENMSSGMLFFGRGKRMDKGANKKTEEAGSTALQAFTVTYSAAVRRSLLESLPLFGCMHNDFLGTPHRVVLLAFEQEDHVSADVIWRLLDFCRLSQLTRATTDALPSEGAATEENQDDLHEATHTSSTPAAAAADIAAAAAQFVARMSVEQLLLAYAGCLLLLNQLQGLQQRKAFDAVEGHVVVHAQQQQLLQHPQQQQFFSPWQSNSTHEQQQWVQQQMLLGMCRQQQQQHHFMLLAQQQNGNSQGHEWQTTNIVRNYSASTAVAESSSREAATAAGQQQMAPVMILQHVRDAGATKLERLLDEALLPVCCCIAYRYDDLRLLESCYWLLRHVLLEKGLPSEWKEQPQQYPQQVVVVGAAGGVPASPTPGGEGDRGEAEEGAARQQQQQREEANDSAAAAYRKDQQSLLREEQPQVHQQAPFLAQQQMGLQQQQICCPQLPPFPSQHVFTHPPPTQHSVCPVVGNEHLETNRRREKPRQTEVDDSWMPPSLFAACTGRKASFSVHKATLKYLSHAVPLAAFWRVVAEEVRRKSAFLAEPRGYLHCEIRRLRTPSGNSFVYPHVYLLFADAASCRQLGLQQQLALQHQQTPPQSQSGEERKKTQQQQQQEGRVLLLFGRKQFEYSTVEFFLPSAALLEAASRCCFASEGEGFAENAVGSVQQLLAAAASAEIYGKDYLGSLHAGFWGTRFSLRHWGMKQPCKLQGGEALPSPLALAFPADAPFSAAAAAAAAVASTADSAAAGSMEACAAPRKKIIYTRVVKVYKKEAEDVTAIHSAAAAAASQHYTQQQQYAQQQRHPPQHQYLHQQHHDCAWQDQQRQRYAGQQEQQYVWQLQQQKCAWQEHMHAGDRGGLRQQQEQHVGTTKEERGKDEEASTAAGAQQVSAGVDLCASKQQDQQTFASEEGASRVKDGLPFFFNCSRSPDETLPAAGEVAEVCSAIEKERGQLQASAQCGSTNTSSSDVSEKQDQQTEVNESAASAAGAAAKSSTQEELRPIHVVPHQQETELCSIEFETNLRGDMPRQMSVKLLRESGSYNLESVKPRWDESIRAYSLPFFGRAKVPSAKNVQLTPSRVESSSRRKRSNGNDKSGRSCSNRRESGKGDPGAPVEAPTAEEDEEIEDEEANTSIYLMMGKLSKDVFALDFRAPVRIFEALAIAAATLAKKRAVS